MFEIYSLCGARADESAAKQLRAKCVLGAMTTPTLDYEPEVRSLLLRILLGESVAVLYSEDGKDGKLCKVGNFRIAYHRDWGCASPTVVTRYNDNAIRIL